MYSLLFCLINVASLLEGKETEGVMTDSINFVVWPGMGSTCHNQSRWNWLKPLLECSFPEANIYCIGENKHGFWNMYDSVIGNMSTQVEEACHYLKGKEPIRKHGYHAIGMSQGSQFLRAVIQRCSNLTAHSLVTIGGQHQGVYGLPACLLKHRICRILRDFTDYLVRFKLIQSILIQAQYWHNPNHALYRKYSTFLADINQENTVNAVYKDRMIRLKKLVLIQFGNDESVEPAVSSSFGYYFNTTTIVSMQYMPTWNTLGLDTLYNSNRLKIYNLSGFHMHMTDSWFRKTLIPMYEELHGKVCPAE